MPKRRYRSKTQWIGQPRDSQGRWARIGSSIAKGFKKAGSGITRVGGAVARANGLDFGYSISPTKGAVGGSATYTRKLPGGYASTTMVTTRIHPQGKSPFERATDAAAEKGLSSIRNKRAQSVARAITGRQDPRKGGVRVSNGTIRSRTKKERENALKRVAKRQTKKRRKLERARGVPSTITGQKKARKQRRGA